MKIIMGGEKLLRRTFLWSVVYLRASLHVTEMILERGGPNTTARQEAEKNIISFQLHRSDEIFATHG